VTEIVVVMGIVGMLASLIFPVLAQARMNARVSQCTSNLRQLGQALVMYDMDHDRLRENYPDRLTHLAAMGYVPDERLFICPMDPTKAKGKGLKPGKPSDDKSDWAERATTPGLRNSSYLYEFSTRTMQSYQVTGDGLGGITSVDWVGSSWPSQWLVSWYSDERWDSDTVYTNYSDNVPMYDGDTSVNLIVPANPLDVDRGRYIAWTDLGKTTGTGTITLQDAKFAQMENGDVYITGYTSDAPVPASWDSENSPYWTVGGDNYAQHNYARTWMPIVRCFYHQTPALVDEQKFEEVLNLAVDGNTFYSAPGWEETAWNLGRQNTGLW
jgi:type II secretory pathway pseudopilin PulG